MNLVCFEMSMRLNNHVQGCHIKDQKQCLHTLFALLNYNKTTNKDYAGSHVSASHVACHECGACVSVLTEANI